MLSSSLFYRGSFQYHHSLKGRSVGNEDGPFWVYVLENPEDRFYIGSADNLDARVQRHKQADPKGTRYSSKHGPWQLDWSESHPDRFSAMRCEKQIKGMKSVQWIRQELLGRKAQ
ncbi:MAG: GIY-YIG nuclease family protein [Planctomycetes bacterium]|nr:GIY-YIG nuclease family protein [Planctomycetota bacterium]